MPNCSIKHTPHLVNNHYTKGEIDTESFSEGEWKTEKVCKDCGMKLEVPEFYKELIQK
jgi:hypothetical protein